MNIMIIASSAPFGKGESFVISEANEIAKNCDNLVLVPTIIRKKYDNKFKLNNNINLVAINLFSLKVMLAFIKLFFLKPLYTIKMFYIVTDKKIINSIKNYVIVPKAVWLSKYIKSNHIDHIHAHWLTTPSTLALLAGYMTGVGWSATAHRGDIVASNLLEKKIKYCRFIRFISASGIDLIKNMIKLDNNKCVLLHMGVNVENNLTEAVGRIKRDNSKVVIVCPANLIPVKGHGFLFKALKKMTFIENVELFIVGDGKLRRDLEDIVKKYNLQSHINFCGHIPNSDLLAWYKTGMVDVVVLPSLDLGNGLHEGIPVSLMEAMANRIPVLSTRTGGIPELLKDENGEYGFMVDYDDIDSLSNTLDTIVINQDLRKIKGNLGYKRVYSSFNVNKVAHDLLELINRHI